MSKFKSFAQSGNFRDYQLIAPDETSKIREETQRNIRGRQRAQDFLEENNRIYERAQLLAQGQEQEQREQNFKLETENRQAYRDALDRDFRIENANNEQKAKQQEKLYSDLSTFSKTAFELYRSVDETITKNQTKHNAALAYSAGADLNTVVSIQSLSDNLTRAEFAQQDFIRQKLEEGFDLPALFALYQNRSTRGFINNIAVAQNTAYAERARISLELVEWRQQNQGATPQEERAYTHQLVREAAANVTTVGDRTLNPDLANQHIFPILRQYETNALSKLDRADEKYRKETLIADTTTALNQKWETGGAQGVIQYIYENPSSEKFQIFADWVRFRSKDFGDQGFSAEVIDEILDTPFPGPNLDSEGVPQYTTLREIRAGREDLAIMTNAASARYSAEVQLFRTQNAKQQQDAERDIAEMANRFGPDGDQRYSQEELQMMQDREDQIPGFESVTLKDIRDSQTGDAASDAVGVQYLEALEISGNLTPAAVNRLPLTPAVKKEWLARSSTQEAFFTKGVGADHIAQIKSAIAGSQFVKTAPITGATSWTVKSYTAKRIALYKKLVAEGAAANISPQEIYNQVMRETLEFVGDEKNFDLGGTGEIISELESIEGDGFKASTLQYQEFRKGLANPLFKTDPKFAASSIGAANIFNGFKQVSETGQVPEMFKVGARMADMTPYEFMNWIAEGNGLEKVQLNPVVQQMADAALRPATRRYYVHPTQSRVDRANYQNFYRGDGTEYPVRSSFQQEGAVDEDGLIRHPQYGHFEYSRYPNLYINFGKYLQGLGFKVAEHADFGGVAPGVHSPYGYHPHNEGFDITDHRPGNWQERTKRFKEVMLQLGLFNQVLGPGDANHETHVDLGGLRRIPNEEDFRILNQFKL